MVSRRRSLGIARIILLALAIVVMLSACAGEPERDAIRLQGNAVGGGQLYFEDLASEDTLLWFWAPW